MAITIDNYRIIPYSQKSLLPKVIFGGTWGIEITLPTAHESGDGYILALDYERIVYPLARPVCAYSNDFALDGDALSMSVSLDTLRLAKWVSSIRKPTPICVQIVRVRGEAYETLLLDEILALPSVIDGDAYADPHSPIMDTLADYVGDGSTTIRQGGVVKGTINANQKTDNVIDLDAGGGGGSVEQATDAEIDARESTTHAITPNNLDYAGRSVVPNVTTIPAATTAYALLDATATTNAHSWQYTHAPTAASTYTLPAVTDTAVAHYIRLTIDFTSVQTYAFEDSNGTALAPLFTPTISAGDVYEFDCEYSVAKAQWLIWPHKQGSVSDDYVMQSEVGAANGVAELDENGTVPLAQLQYAASNKPGIVRPYSAYGTTVTAGYLQVVAADANGIASRSNYRVISPNNLNIAVTAALTDANKISLTAAQKASAQDTLGAAPATLHLDAAPTTSTVGAFGQKGIVDATGKEYTCTAVTVDETDPQNPVTTYTWTDDINSKGGTFSNGLTIQDVPSSLISLNYNYNVVQLTNQYTRIKNKTLSIEGNTVAGGYLRIKDGTGENDYMYNNGVFYAKDTYQQGITVIPAATTSYNLAEGVQSHAPAEASTYVFPAVTDTTRTHRIRLILDFTTVQTYAFEDAQGNALAPLFTPTISAGDVYEFDCEYSVAKSTWLIWPHKQGAVSDDYVMQSEVGAANGVAGLDGNGLVPRSQLKVGGEGYSSQYVDNLGVLGFLGGMDSFQVVSGFFAPKATSDAELGDRTSLTGIWLGGKRRPVLYNTLDRAVTQVLAGEHPVSLTSAQQQTAQSVIGAYGTLHLDAAPTTSTVGAFGQRAIVDSTGKAYTCTAVTTDETDPQNPVTTYTWHEDLPVASGTTYGAVKIASNINTTGIGMMNNGAIYIGKASDAQLDNKVNDFMAVVPANLEYAVRSVLPNITEIPAATSAYTLIAQDATTNSHCAIYEHAPESAPTYTLPAVTGNAVKREIILTVRFSASVLTYAFEDSAGNAITPLPLAGTIADGSVVAFRCTWEALLGQWVIMPVMLGTYSA